MRKWNGIISALIMILFLLHGILGAFQLLGAGNVVSAVLAYALMVLVLIHMYIGIVLTGQTLKSQKAAGKAYFRENLIFWTRRVSGFVMMLLLLFHVSAFSDNTGEKLRLVWFDRAKLITQLLLAASLLVHILSNIKPAMMTYGIKGVRKWTGTLLFVLSVLLLFMAAAFIVYYYRWNKVGL